MSKNVLLPDAMQSLTTETSVGYRERIREKTKLLLREASIV